MSYINNLLGVYNTSAPTLTNGNSNAVQLDVNGNLKVVFPATPTVTVGNASLAVTGTFWQSTQPVSIATAPVLVAGSAIIGKVGIDQTTPGTTNAVAATLNAETTKVLGVVRNADGSGNLLTSTTNALDVNIKTNAVKGSNTSANSFPVVIASDQGAVKTTLSPVTTGGCSTYSGSVGATATAVKASAGQLYGMEFGNSNTGAVYVQIFDVAVGSVTLGTTPPKMSVFIPAGGGLVRDFSNGVVFATAITYACTTTRAGSTSPSNTVDVNFDYL